MYINTENTHYMYIRAYKLIIREIFVTLVTKVATTLANTSLEGVTNVCYKIKGVKMKIYKDDEYALGKKCFKCKSEEFVFYNKKWDIFTCSDCLHEFEQERDRRLKNFEVQNNARS